MSTTEAREQVLVQRSLLGVIVILLLGAIGYGVHSARTQAAEYPKVHFDNRGEVAVVPRNMRVTVINPDILGSGWTAYRYGDGCDALQGGEMVWLAEIRWGLHESPQVLVKYSHDKEDSVPYCPNRVMFFVSREYFASANEAYKKVQDAEEQRKSFIRAAAEGRQPENTR